ncbi:MAG: hypothetical protein ABSD77_04600 [Verrucomicrobiota bacterium]
MMITIRKTIVLAILSAMSFPLFAQDTNAPLPTTELILRRVVERVKKEGDNDRAFDKRYSYSRTKVTEYRNSAGELKKHEEKSSVHDPMAAKHSQPDAAKSNPDSGKSEAVSDTHSNVRGRQFKRDDFLLNQDLVRRFRFTLVGREWINGRPALTIDFVPVDKKMPERNLKDRFINKAGGRVWVDEVDYCLVKAGVHLTQKVNVGFGLIGAVWKFDYGFERERTDDGLWFTRDVNWHLEGREVVINRRVDYHEKMIDVRRTAP